MMCRSAGEPGPATAGPGNCTSPIYLAAGNEGPTSVFVRAGGLDVSVGNMWEHY